MQNSSFEPLELKLISSIEEKAAFPYEDFSPQPPGIAPEKASEKAPEISAVSRIQQLESMLAEKHAFDANIERDAYDKAYLSGEKAGLALGEKRAEQILEKMVQLQKQAQQQLDEIRNSMCEAVIDISGMLAEWLVGEITAEDRGRLLEMAERAARTFPETERLMMYIHQDEFAQFEKLISESEFKPHLLTDNSIKPGCIRIASIAQDILIDPRAPVADAVAKLKKDLLSGEIDVSTP
ncbi:Flagellar assembly protein FliH [Mariprofundus ferrinatatus]|uniref:Flagellar assembly protein FliH n=1 Tax=Mariprofundus ferrinatatus TaxID=1921087 RepID=A0A2K8L6K7_9PROT|nr:FliH/SctL family protein [Mariprofundus ferrinatatus]ATX82917.1 Flagellar assembly protein FliH [Mariprofundus ferrinatatus]